MIRRNADMQKEMRERMRGGIGTVEIVHIYRKEELRGKTRLFARLRIPPGSSIGYHTHDGEEEVYYVLQGAATITEQGVTSSLGPGDAVLTGGGDGHSIANHGSEALELLAVILVY
jgi:mannose-6-phosphate isomerase-like protein (cupin superfamily)